MLPGKACEHARLGVEAGDVGGDGENALACAEPGERGSKQAFQLIGGEVRIGAALGAVEGHAAIFALHSRVWQMTAEEPGRIAR